MCRLYGVAKMKITFKKHKNALFSAPLRLCVKKRTCPTAEFRIKDM
jgi:hypothetical protein